MIKELIITIYLLAFKLVFNFFKLFPLKHKITFVITFGDNSKYIYDEIKRQQQEIEVVVLYEGASRVYFEEYDEVKKIPFESLNFMQIIKSIYHLATSKYIIVDNYFGFLATTDFRKGAECLQLWHASGAIKKFGLEDQSVQYRSERAKKRFNKVYSKFDKVVIGSDIMGNTFIRSFNIPKEKLLKTGVPRTDFFYKEALHSEIIKGMVRENEALKNKKKILYAPTYRDNELDHFEMKLELDLLYKELGEDYIILLRLHPAIKTKTNYADLYPGFVLDYSSSKYDINHLLLIADYLITDYSSIPYEFSLLNKPIIFFAYDLEKYSLERGLVENYDQMVPGPVVKETNDVIKLIKENQFDMQQLKAYANKWNKYSKGYSSHNVVNYLLQSNSVKLTEKKSIV